MEKPKFFSSPIWIYHDGARLLRRVAPRFRAPNIMFHKNKMGSRIRPNGTVFYSLLYLNSRQGFDGLKYMYSVISVIVDSLPGNTKNRESTRSWTARVRLVGYISRQRRRGNYPTLCMCIVSGWLNYLWVNSNYLMIHRVSYKSSNDSGNPSN